ncbi:ABC multidrug transporter [Grosmannia clavigera kw1407]|uniref:ABC multidrug transporter n=1 Tax=Grosmannia clavigera (strain kw1407 / UAMH 11150) TaxID=655863 RepID=F0XKN4_GROCL|nr:ABC multidrug transporter [Grosmannia clavigera kw1407]EFX01574.1 ABC multidrug transporter [Grosmannia clavigera kw1407]
MTADAASPSPGALQDVDDESEQQAAPVPHSLNPPSESSQPTEYSTAAAEKPHHVVALEAEDLQIRATLEALRARDEQSGLPAGELGMTWRDVTVKAVSSEAALHENVVSQLNLIRTLRDAHRKPPLKTLVDHSHGCVRPGEMLLVLGRPGAGCTTLLNILANRRRGFDSVEGDVRYGSMTAIEAKRYRGQIVMSTEEELHYPTLTVKQTLDFATRLKVPFHAPVGADSIEEVRTQLRNFLLASLHIEHTVGTKVGDAFVRGVSGGERKRVSIAEAMATQGSVYLWDNCTRGLDANTALEFIKAVRAMTDVLGLTSVMTLYQAGNGIYNLFDKVLVLDRGQQVYYGPTVEARPFLEDQGFVCRPGANVADFLTGVTVSTERIIRHGCEATFPRTTAQLRTAYEKSELCHRMELEYVYPDSDAARVATERFQARVVALRDNRFIGLLGRHSPLTVGFASQVRACVIRQYQVLWGDKPTLIARQCVCLVMVLIVGSLFYNAADDSLGLFLKGGALFFSLVFFTMLAMPEVMNSFEGRPIMMEQRHAALFNPAAFCIAQISADVPMTLFIVSYFSLVLYFMVGLKETPAAFFTFWILLFTISMTITALCRAVGALCRTFDAASKIMGILMIAFLTYSGYMIFKPKMHPWFVWIYWISPMSYAFDALLSNELSGAVIACSGINLIPRGPGYENASAPYQSCAGVPGATLFSTIVEGNSYLSALSYSHGHVWRNFGVLWGWWSLFVFVTIVATANWRAASESGPALLIPREKANKVKLPNVEDGLGTDDVAGMGSEKKELSNADNNASDSSTPALMKNTAVFTWKHLHYTVQAGGRDLKLLDNVQGWVRPGMLGALMGSSGAGKTTLLDVLAQRKTEGVIKGSVLVDGRELPVSFQRSTGYCEQLDVHEALATVREALEFSALLRQDRHTPRAEKLAYVDTIINLLELNDLADTLIGRIGNGLSVEQRKRVTIGVELVAKPSLLIFLDEPTTGLDGQSAFNTVRFLRKLADAGQAVLVTIHQPSAQLFAQFDTLLLLTMGGKMVYFGDIGVRSDINGLAHAAPADSSGHVEDSSTQTVREYFARYGAPCPSGVNPAEHMIDVVSGRLSQNKDWHQIWLDSPEKAAMDAELDRMVVEARAKPRLALTQTRSQEGTNGNLQLHRTLTNATDATYDSTAPAPPSLNTDDSEFAAPLWEQICVASTRMNRALYRNTDYINNKIYLHILTSLFTGFSFWKIGSSVLDLQLRLFAVFSFVFVAPGVINQLQPLFIERRDIFETREKKAKMYSWIAFVTALIVSELPYLVVCSIIYFFCWYYTVGFPHATSRAGSTYFMVLLYEFLYTGIGQFVAAYAPNAVFAHLMNPFVIGILLAFCGVLVPYSEIQPFWRYWMYYLNPFNYLMSGLLVFDSWDSKVRCRKDEFAYFNPPDGQTCGEYLGIYLQTYGRINNLENPEDTSLCRVCQYRSGTDYLYTVNIDKYGNGWRDAGILVIFVLSSYSLVYGLMKLRTKMSKKAE